MSADPKYVLEVLRDHLSAHDRTILFLFGAGTSFSVKDARTQEPLIPTLQQLTESCAKILAEDQEKYAQAWQAIVKECHDLHLPPHLENILTRISIKIDALSGDETLNGLQRADFEHIDERIRKFIAAAVQPPLEALPKELPHTRFAYWVGRTTRHRSVEIFTTNYDLLLEQSLESQNIAIFDGFVGSDNPFFSNPLSRTGEKQMTEFTKLWKIHGSVNWRMSPSGTHVIRREPVETGEMVFPSLKKYDESRREPYRSILERLSALMLNADPLLVSCGYRFNDPHIDSIIFHALESNKRSHVISFQYDEPESGSTLLSAAKRLRNLWVLSRENSYISGVPEAWRLPNPPDDRTPAYVGRSFAFDKDGDGTRPTGKLLLPDFNRLAAFLFEVAGVQEPHQ